MGVYDNADENLFSKFCRKPSAAANFVPSDIFLKCRLHWSSVSCCYLYSLHNDDVKHYLDTKSCTVAICFEIEQGPKTSGFGRRRRRKFTSVQTSEKALILCCLTRARWCRSKIFTFYRYFSFFLWYLIISGCWEEDTRKSRSCENFIKYANRAMELPQAPLPARYFCRWQKCGRYKNLVVKK